MLAGRLALLFTGACGRIAFDPAETDTTVDGRPGLDLCGRPTTAEPMIVVSGVTTFFTSQTGGVPEGNVTVTLRDGAHGPVRGVAVSDAMTGAYTLAATTGGTPVDFVVTTSRADVESSVALGGFLLDQDLAGYNASVTPAGAIDALYAAGGVTRMAGASVIAAAFYPCAGTSGLGGATFTTPQAQTVYVDASGSLSTALSASEAPFGTAYLFNVPIGDQTITVSHPSYGTLGVVVPSTDSTLTSVVVRRP